MRNKQNAITRYGLFKELKQLCELTKTGKYQYNKIIQSGELIPKHYDCGTGYYDVSIYYCYKILEKAHYCRISFGTIDDGDFGSWTQCETKEKLV